MCFCQQKSSYVHLSRKRTYVLMCFCQKNPYVHLRRKRTYVLMVMGVGGVKNSMA